MVQAEESKEYYQFGKPIIQEITDQELQQKSLNLGTNYYKAPQQYKGITGAISTINSIVNIGKTLWTIVKENKPVVNMQTDHVSAIPANAKSVYSLNNWSTPKTRTYQIVYQNGFGMNVLEFVYRIVFTHSGKLNDKGNYIANAAIYPVHLNVAWGYTFNAETFVPPAVNLSSKDNPIAGLELHLGWKLETPIQHSQRTVSAFLDGTGNIEVYQ
jgi:hypothetical protein